MDPAPFNPTEFFTALGPAAQLGALGIVALVLRYVVRIYAWAPVQGAVVAVLGFVRVPRPERFTWGNLTRFAKLVLVLGFAGAGALVTHLWVVPVGIWAALGGAVSAALLAVGADQAAQSVVQDVIAAVKPKGTGKDPSYEASPSRPMSILLKLDPSRPKVAPPAP